MSEKSQKFIKSALEAIKKGNFEEALSDLDVAKTFQNNNPKTYLLIISCYLKLDKLDKMYETIQEAKAIISDKEQEQLFVPLQKYYSKKGMIKENVEILSRLCIKQIKDDITKLDGIVKEFAQVELEWLSNSQFIEQKNILVAINEEINRVYTVTIDTMATEKLSNETLELLFFLYASIITKYGAHDKDISRVVKQLKEIAIRCPKNLSGKLLEEGMFQLMVWLMANNYVEEKNIVIYEVLSHFTSSTLSLYYQLKFFATNQGYVKRYLPHFIQAVYETLAFLYYPELVTSDFQADHSKYKEYLGEKQSKEETSTFIIEFVYGHLERKHVCQEFQTRAEILMLYSQKFINIVDIKAATLANLKVFEKKLEYLIKIYTEQSEIADATQEIEDTIYCNPLFEAYIMANHHAFKSSKKTLLYQFKRTIDRLEQQQEKVDHLKEIYNRWGLKIIDDQEELQNIQKMLKYQIEVAKSDDNSNLINLKVYYEYCIKLNKLFRIYDGSIKLKTIVESVVKREPANIYFQGENWWIQFSNSENKKEYFQQNLATLFQLKESAVLQNQKDVASILQKRISLLMLLFGDSSSEEILSALDEAQKLESGDYQIYVIMALVHFSNNNLKEALVKLQTAFLYRQHDIFLNKMLFFTLHKLGMKSEAIDFLYRIYPAFKQIFWINRILGVYFSNIGDYKKATSFCQKALELYQFDKERSYRLHYEKISQLAPGKSFDIPHMIDYADILYFDDYLVFNDQVYSKEAINLSSNLITDPQHRLHIKLLISLAQADKMQGKTCSSLSAIEDAEKVYLQVSNADKQPIKEAINIDENDSQLKSTLAKDVFHTLQIFSSVFLVSKSSNILLTEYNLNDDIKNIIDALTINFEFAQITSYLQDTHKTYQRIRIFLVICYKVLERISGQGNENKNLESTIYNMYEQMTGFILEMSLNFVKFHWKKYTLSSAKYIIEKILQIRAPNKRSVLVNVAFSEFYTISGFINQKESQLEQSIVYLKEILQTLSIDFQQDIVDNINTQKINSLEVIQINLFKYVLKNLCLSHFYLYKINSANQNAYNLALKICTSGILIFNLDIDFYNYYGLIEQKEEIQIGAFVKSNRIQKNSLALDSLAFIYLKKQRYEEAANMLLKSIEVNTNNPTAYIGLFIIQYNMALAFNSIVSTGNDDNSGTYTNLQKNMIEKCGSYLHFVKQIEISASSVLFDGLLEYLQYNNERSHISYQFSTDLFDRAPQLVDTQLGQLYQIMILKQTSTPEKKLEVFEKLRNKIPAENLQKLFIDKSTELNSNFLTTVEKRIKEEIQSISSDIKECNDFNSQEFTIVCREFDYLIKNLKLYLSLALYTNLESRGLEFFTQITKSIQTSVNNFTELLSSQSNYIDLTPVYITMAELEYHIIQKIKPGEIEDVLKRLSNLKTIQMKNERVQVWPYSSEFTKRVTQPSQYKYLLGVHSYKTKEYQKSKKFFFQAIQLDPSIKQYVGAYFEYLITQQRFPIFNPHNKNNTYEQTLLVHLNNPNFSLKKKISEITKAAMYLDKPYLYYLLVHFQFEESSNYTPSRLIKLLDLLKTKVLNDKYDPEGYYKKKGIKLFIEITVALEKMNSNDSEIKQQLSEYTSYINKECESNVKFADYRHLIQVFYKDTSSSEFISDLQALLSEEDEQKRVTAYLLAFNIIRKLIREQKTNGMIQVLSALSSCIYTSVQEGLISQEVQSSNKGKILMNMIQHIDGYQYILALQEDYKDDSLYEKQDIQEMIHNAASYVHENYPGSISMKFLYMQHLYRQEKMDELKKELGFMKSTQFSCRNDDLVTIFYYTLYYYYYSTKDIEEDNIYNFVEFITIIQDQYKHIISSDLNTLLHFLQGVIYLRISEKRPDLDKKTIMKEFQQAILYSPEFAGPILKFLKH